MKCYFNGKICDLKDVKIGPYDIGLLRGYGVFDVMRAANGKPFLLEEHWKRLVNSAKELNLKIPANKKEFEDIIKKLLKLNGFKQSTIRTVLTGGESCDTFTPCGKENFFILVEKFQSLPAEVFVSGAWVMTLEFERHLPIAKITNYVEAIRNHRRKMKNKCLEIIYVKNGQALEASSSNFFIFKKGILITPKNKILFGTTRNLVIKLAKEKFKVEERNVSEKELRGADEVFLTATNKDVVPVVKIDGKKAGNGKVGKNTKIIMELFREYYKKY